MFRLTVSQLMADCSPPTCVHGIIKFRITTYTSTKIIALPEVAYFTQSYRFLCADIQAVDSRKHLVIRPKVGVKSCKNHMVW